MKNRKEILKRRNELLRKSKTLREASHDTSYSNGKRIRLEQDEVYKHWKFYKNIMESMEKVEKEVKNEEPNRKN